MDEKELSRMRAKLYNACNLALAVEISTSCHYPDNHQIPMGAGKAVAQIRAAMDAIDWELHKLREGKK